MNLADYPPSSLTADQFRSDWEPKGWKLLVIGPTATWRTEWGVWEAIRDIVQNCLDEAEEYAYGYDSDGMWISDSGRGVSVADFLLGPPQLKAEYARGRYGEGMKIAALTLLRNGYKVVIETIGRELWLCFVRQAVDSEADTLAALWRPNGSAIGTIFHIIGYFGDDFADRFVPNIRQGNVLFRGPSPVVEPVQRYNELLESPPGRTYGRDIYMKDIESPWSYNLWGFEMAPDRHGPKDEVAVAVDAARLWATCTEVFLIRRLLGMLVYPPEEDTWEARFIGFGYALGTEPSSGELYTTIMDNNAPLWKEAWEANFGAVAVIGTRTELRPTVEHLGYKSLSTKWEAQDALGFGIKTDVQLVRQSQAELSKTETIPDDRLPPEQLIHLSLARGIANNTPSVRPPTGGVHAAIIPRASDQSRTAGLYDNITQQISISSESLRSGRAAVDVVIHELAHHTSRAEDGTEKHNRALSEVAAQVVLGTVRGKYDAFKEGVEW